MPFWNGDTIKDLKPNHVLIYGANPEFRNGKGVALLARKFGAKPYGGGRGIVGQSYGLITKNLLAGFTETLKDGTVKTYPIAGFRSVSKSDILFNIEELYECCKENPKKLFVVAYKNNSQNLNGYTSVEIYRLFLKAGENVGMPKNIYFHSSFRGIQL